MHEKWTIVTRSWFMKSGLSKNLVQKTYCIPIIQKWRRNQKNGPLLWLGTGMCYWKKNNSFLHCQDQHTSYQAKCPYSLGKQFHKRYLLLFNIFPSAGSHARCSVCEIWGSSISNHEDYTIFTCGILQSGSYLAMFCRNLLALRYYTLMKEKQVHTK